MSEWAALHQMEPFGDDRADIRIVWLGWLIHQLHQGEDGDRMGFSNFMEKYWFDWSADPDENKKRQQERVVTKWRSAIGG